MTNNNLNDDSNPQQGSTAPTQIHSPTNGPPTDNTMFKIPPTKKDNRKLFVGGLPPKVTDKEFREFFERYGQILDSIVMIDRETKKSRGFGFVTFENPDVANRIVAENIQDDSKSRVQILDKWCEVKPSEPKKGGSHGGRYPDSRGRSMVSTAGTSSEMSSRNSSIDTRTSSRPLAEVNMGIAEASNGEVPMHHHGQQYPNYPYQNAPNAMSYQNSMVYPMAYYPPYAPPHMNMAQAPHMYHQHPPQGAGMMYNNEAMYNIPQYYGHYGNMYQYPPMQMPPNGSNGLEFSSCMVQEEQMTDDEE